VTHLQPATFNANVSLYQAYNLANGVTRISGPAGKTKQIVQNKADWHFCTVPKKNGNGCKNIIARTCHPKRINFDDLAERAKGSYLARFHFRRLTSLKVLKIEIEILGEPKLSCRK